MKHVLELAGIEGWELIQASHFENYWKLYVQVENGQVTDAKFVECICRDEWQTEWDCIYTTGCGSIPCNCYDCEAGDDPEWTRYGDGEQDFLDNIQEELDRLLKGGE